MHRVRCRPDQRLGHRLCRAGQLQRCDRGLLQRVGSDTRGGAVAGGRHRECGGHVFHRLPRLDERAERCAGRTSHSALRQGRVGREDGARQRAANQQATFYVRRPDTGKTWTLAQSYTSNGTDATVSLKIPHRLRSTSTRFTPLAPTPRSSTACPTSWISSRSARSSRRRAPSTTARPFGSAANSGHRLRRHLLATHVGRPAGDSGRLGLGEDRHLQVQERRVCHRAAASEAHHLVCGQVRGLRLQGLHVGGQGDCALTGPRRRGQRLRARDKETTLKRDRGEPRGSPRSRRHRGPSSSETTSTLTAGSVRRLHGHTRPLRHTRSPRRARARRRWRAHPSWPRRPSCLECSWRQDGAAGPDPKSGRRSA